MKYMRKCTDSGNKQSVLLTRFIASSSRPFLHIANSGMAPVKQRQLRGALLILFFPPAINKKPPFPGAFPAYFFLGNRRRLY